MLCDDHGILPKIETVFGFWIGGNQINPLGGYGLIEMEVGDAVPRCDGVVQAAATVRAIGPAVWANSFFINTLHIATHRVIELSSIVP